MKTDTDNYILPIERGLRFLLSDVIKTVLIILSIVVINYLLLGLYVLFTKFNFISYLMFLGLIGIGTYFIINQFNNHSKKVIQNSDKSLSEKEESTHYELEESVQNLSENTWRKVKHMQNLLKREGLSNMTIKDEDIETFKDVPAFIREKSLSEYSMVKLKRVPLVGIKYEDKAGKEFEDRIKTILSELFEEITNELSSLESDQGPDLEPKIINEIEKPADRDVKKLKELLTILYEILGEDFLNEKYKDKKYKALIDMDYYLKSIKGKFKTLILHNPTH